MAWQTSKRVWDHTKEIKESDKVMLLALADKADESGICWPKFDTSYETLSSMVGINRRSAIRIVERLEEWGHVYIDEHAVGRGNSNLFLIVSGLSSTEIESLLIEHFDKSSSEATLCATSLLDKQDAHRKGVMGNTKRFPKKPIKGVTDSANGVTPNTISNEKKGVTGDKKVLPVTRKGVMGNTQSKSPSDSTPNGAGDKSPQVENSRASPAQLMFGALAKVCKINWKIATNEQKGELNQSEKILRVEAEATPEDLPEFEKWWYKHDWRGKGGSPPTPSQVREVWQQFLDYRDKTGVQKIVRTEGGGACTYDKPI